MIDVALWDSNFAGQPCSVWNQDSQHIRYVRDQKKWNGVAIFTDEWANNPVVDEVESPIKIAWIREPRCLHPLTYERVQQNAHKFDKVLTYYQPLLDLGDPYTFAPYGGCWIPRQHWGIKPKTKNISMLIGSKMTTEGHRLRHQGHDALWAAGLGHAVDFYGVYGEPVDYSWQTKYKVLADYRYSIVIEACREDNLFTEILLDCFAMGTIPIFWGAPNIGEFFDERGVFSFKNITGLIEILGNYTYNATYAITAQSVVRNLNRLAEYAVTEDWIWENVLKEMV